MQNLRLTNAALDFWIDVRLREFDGRWLAVADLAGVKGWSPLAPRRVTSPPPGAGTPAV